ncbi:MAG: inorganic phosphate transporter [Magnetococcales bacterium]|nr:inorganic phosphate transporter [Magnetococcales bacterium]
MEVILEYGYLFVALAAVFGLFMCWGIGANDVANVMGTAVGSGAITVKQAIVIAAIFEFAGALLAGGSVTSTIRKEMVVSAPFEANPELLVYGMMAALFSAAMWLMVASARGWPVSTTHSVVGAIVGFALFGFGMDALRWDMVSTILLSWILSPILSGIIGFLLIISIRNLILNQDNPVQKARLWGPAYIFLVGWILALVTFWNGLPHLGVDLGFFPSLLAAIGVGLLTAFVGKMSLSRVRLEDKGEGSFHFASVESLFSPLMPITACALAFAHGSNDVSNGIGPLAAVWSIVVSNGSVTQTTPLAWWVFALGGAGIILGLATMGFRVMETIGMRITELSPTRGFAATMAAATTVALASQTGMPVSTTHIAVGAVMGVGLARGIGALDLRVIGGILVSWVATLPLAGALAAVIYYILRSIFS